MKYAGVSTGSIRKALDDAESGGFVRCVTPGVKKSRRRSGRVAEYRLRWSSEDADYTNDPKLFEGFYAGEGCRSPIPNGFFDVVVRQETLAMAKVVGTVLRHTVGYANQFGTGRRSEAPLPYSYIHEFANLKDPTTLSNTLKDAVKKHYIEKVSEGCFDTDAGKQSHATTYAVKWLDKATNHTKTPKTLAGESQDPKNPSGKTTRTPAAKDSKNPSDRKTSSKDSYKQQDVVAENSESYALLVGEGINRNTAIKLSGIISLKAIKNQIEWLDSRKAENRPAMLRKAIEEGWEQPASAQQQKHLVQSQQQEQEQDAETRAEEERQHQQRHRRRSDLLERWTKETRKQQDRFYEQTIEQATSPSNRRRLIRNRDLSNPATEVLEEMVRELAVPIGEST